MIERFSNLSINTLVPTGNKKNPLALLLSEHSVFFSQREHCGRLLERVASKLILHRNLISVWPTPILVTLGNLQLASKFIPSLYIFGRLFGLCL